MGATFSTHLCVSVGQGKVPGGVHLPGPCVPALPTSASTEELTK